MSLKKFVATFFIIFSFFANAISLSYTDVNTSLSDIFYTFADKNEGTTNFRSLMIPFGGRTESLGSAFTGLCDDLSYLRFNPAGASVLKQTQFSVFHNGWIADSKLETIAFSTRSEKNRNFGYGGFVSCFYVPFTEYNIFGERVAASYYTESVVALNFAYNFLAGYDFKGFALGVNLKGAYQGLPDYTDNDTNEIIKNSGLAQSSVGIMGDVGLLLQFNFFKYYYSRDPNIRIGFSAQNLGATLTGFGESVKIGEPLPTTFAAGMSVKFIKPMTVTVDYVQPVNLFAPDDYILGYINSGVDFQFASFLSLMGGFSIRGGNPRFSAGFEFEASKIRLNFNYTLDLTSSFAPLNKISLSAKVNFGDKGRSIVDAQVDEYYQLGLKYYADALYEDAILVWEEAIKLNKRFDPAILGIQSAQSQITMFKNIEESLRLE